MKFRVARFSFTLAFGFITFTGCSPGMFFGGKDQKIIETPNYRRLNPDCASINLSSPTVDVPLFRKILGCFNSNGSLEPINRLVKGLQDNELEPMVSGVNKRILNNKKKLYEIEQTYKTLESKGIADNLFLQFGKLLENEDLVSSSIAIFNEGYNAHGEDLLKIIELISKDLTDERMSFALDLSSSISSQDSFKALRGDFSKSIPAFVGSSNFESLVKEVFAYIQEDHTYSCGTGRIPLRNEFIRAVLAGDSGSAGDLFSALDEIIGGNETEVRRNILPIVNIFQSTLNANGDGHPLMERLTSALRDLQVPVECMNSAKSIPNASLHLIRELVELPESSGSNVDIAARYILRDTPLNLMSLGPFCNYPSSLKTHYPTMIEFAKTGAIDPLARTLRAFSRVTRSWDGCEGIQSSAGERYNPLLNWLVNFMADTGKDSTLKGAGIYQLIPSLVEVTTRDAWTDLLLVSALPTTAHQQRIKELAQYILKPRVELRARSIYDVLMEVIPANKVPEILSLANGIRKFINNPDPVVEPGLGALRQALYVNNVHPFLELMRESFSEATQETAFYSAIFKVANQPDFLASVKLISSMGKDGSLKGLIKDTLDLFHRFAEEAKNESAIRETTTPSPLTLRHHLNRDKLDVSPHLAVTSQMSWYTPSCDSLDVSFSLDQTDSTTFDDQVLHYISCQNGSGGPNDVTEAINFLTNNRAENGQSFLKYQIAQTKKMLVNEADPTNKLDSREINYLLDSWMSSMDDGRFFRLLDAVPFWVRPGNALRSSVQSASSANSTVEGELGIGLVVKPLLDVTRAVITHSRRDLVELEQYVAKVIAEPGFPKILGDLDDLLTPDLSVKAESLASVAPLPPALASFSRDEIKLWVESLECEHLSNDSRIRNEQIEKRVDEILSEAQNNVTTWDLVRAGQNQEGSPRQSWKFDELQKLLKPIFDKLADREKQSVSHKWVLSSFINFTHYFTMPPDGRYQNQEEKTRFHFQPQYILDWLYDRSTDYRLINYYYPGEESPRVRLVNTLDLLELTLVNVDYVAPFPVSKNLGLEFLSELADAWGDEPRDMWPEEIQRLKNPPRTLVAAVEDILDRHHHEFLDFDNLKKMTYELLGVPVLPACHRSIPGSPLPDIQAPGAPWWQTTVMGISAVERKKLQKEIYNLWQVQVVLRENAQNGGMKVLRDLFYEVKYSTPEKFRAAKAGDANNLSLILKSVRLGMLRQVGRQVQKFERNNTALMDLFQAVIHSGTSPNMLPVMDALLNSDPEHKLIWKVIQEVFDIIDSGTPVDLANMKQLFFYFMANSNRIEAWVPSHGERPHNDLIDHVLWRAYESLNDYPAFWANPKVDFLGDLFKSKTMSSFGRVFYEGNNSERNTRLRNKLVEILTDSSGDSGSSRVHNGMEILKAVYENDQSRDSFNVFRKRFDAVTALDSYKSLDLDRSVRPILRFFEERGANQDVPVSAADRLLAKKLRVNMSSILKEHNLDELLLLEKSDPDRFYQLLETLSRLSSGDRTDGLKNFFGMVRRSLSERPY